MVGAVVIEVMVEIGGDLALYSGLGRVRIYYSP